MVEGPAGRFEKEDVHQTREVRRQQEHAHQEEMKRDLLEAEVVRHVEHEHLDHVGQADHRAKHRGAGDEQQQAAHQLCEPGEDLVRR